MTPFLAPLGSFGSSKSDLCIPKCCFCS